MEFACGISPPAQGRPLRERLDRRRRALQARPAGRGRHHLAVQLPGDGADVVLPDRDRGRQHRRPQAQREGPVGVAVDRAAVEGGRSPRRRLQRAPGRQGGGRRAAAEPGRAGDQLRRLDADRRVRLPAGLAARQARAGPRRRQEPHGRPPRRRPRPGRRLGRQRRLRQRGRALHGDQRARGRRPDRRRARRPDRRPHPQHRHRRRQRRRDGQARPARPTWARWSRRPTATRSSGYIDSGQRDGAKVVVDGREVARGARAPRTASGSGRRCSTT